ncbi:MAG TPA: DUF992 domain-containing protein [Roseiarcus sp.]|nr:DUF992 domain-containing protein [Roseiarcus sp.]
MNFRFVLRFAVASAVIAASLPALSQERVKIGNLRCEVSGGLGLIITSTKEMECAFTAPNASTP